MSIAEKLTTIAENEQKIYDKGADDGMRKYWECFTQNGARKEYKYGFMNTDFSGETIPSDLFKASISSFSTFQSYKGKALPLGIDFSGVPAGTNTVTCTGYRLFFGAENLEEVYDIQLPAQGTIQSMFEGCKSLKKIDKLTVKSSTQFTNTFINCNALTDITIDGTIGQSISFQYSPLSVASMKSVISHLATVTTSKTVTFTDACWTALEASGKPFDDGLTDDETLTWTNYVISLGWSV